MLFFYLVFFVQVYAIQINLKRSFACIQSLFSEIRHFFSKFAFFIAWTHLFAKLFYSNVWLWFIGEMLKVFFSLSDFNMKSIKMDFPLQMWHPKRCVYKSKRNSEMCQRWFWSSQNSFLKNLFGNFVICRCGVWSVFCCSHNKIIGNRTHFQFFVNVTMKIRCQCVPILAKRELKTAEPSAKQYNPIQKYVCI